jgi:hypothetical protein
LVRHQSPLRIALAQRLGCLALAGDVDGDAADQSRAGDVEHRELHHQPLGHAARGAQGFVQLQRAVGGKHGQIVAAQLGGRVGGELLVGLSEDLLHRTPKALGEGRLIHTRRPLVSLRKATAGRLSMNAWKRNLRRRAR